MDDLGGNIMENAWAGFNTTLLAYGQPGSGKPYSMFGYGDNKGLIRLFCEDLFEKTISKFDPSFETHGRQDH
jgi:kinesin family protein 1